MTYQDALRDAFHVNKIKRVAIVDDGYDAPSPDRLPEADRNGFRTNLDDAVEEGDPNGIGQECIARGIGSLQEMAARCDEPAYVRSLWAAYRGAGRAGPLGTLLHRLFSTYAVDRGDKLGPLGRLEEMVLEASGIEPVRFDGQARPEDLVEYDLIFLDYYLEEPVVPDDGAERALVDGTMATGRERSIAFLATLVEASPKRVPLVMLISSEATAADIPEFRKNARMLASAVQFLPKKQVIADPFQARAVLHGLVLRRLEVDALCDLLGLWQNAVEAASREMMGVVRELDLPDYSYLQNYRLANEGVPLAHYLVWLFNGYLSDLVEKKLHDVTAAKLVGKLALAEGFPGRVAPTEAISQLYGSITTSTVPMGLDGFSPRTWAGDIYVRTDEWHRIAGEDAAVQPPFDQPMPEVLAVVTPACDLVPGRSDNLRTVTMVAGTLVPVAAAMSASTHFLVVRDKQFHVTWNPKWPITVPIGSMDGASALGGRYRWVGRLRELYHADVQQTLMRDIGRVGLPVAPTLPQWSALRVLAKVDRSFAEVFAAPACDRAVWSFLLSTKGAEKMLQLREDVAWQVRSRVLELTSGKDDKASKKVRERVDTAAFISKMQRPMVVKKDSHDDQEADLRVRRGTPNVGSDEGVGCERAILVIFGDDVPLLP